VGVADVATRTRHKVVEEGILFEKEEDTKEYNIHLQT
jgi:hypothetical protein